MPQGPMQPYGPRPGPPLGPRGAPPGQRPQQGHPQSKRCRYFVALFEYDPATMSPNPESCDEELPFNEGDTIKVGIILCIFLYTILHWLKSYNIKDIGDFIIPNTFNIILF